MKGVRGRYTSIHLWFYIVCLGADANVITGVMSGDPIMVTLRCSCLPISLCSKCLAPVAAGGGSCCQGAVGSSRNGSLTFAEPSSVLCLLVWLSVFGKVKLQKENLGGG